MSEPPQQAPEGFRPQSPWPAARRSLAVALWSGILGASLMLLGLLMSWDHLWPDTRVLDWSVLAVLFLLGWLVCIVTALITQVLSRPPGAHYQPLSLEDEDER